MPHGSLVSCLYCHQRVFPDPSFSSFKMVLDGEEEKLHLLDNNGLSFLSEVGVLYRYHCNLSLSAFSVEKPFFLNLI